MGFFDFLNSNNHVIAKIDSNGTLRDRNNSVCGRITFSGEVQDRNNHTLGHANGIPRHYAAVFFFFDF